MQKTAQHFAVFQFLHCVFITIRIKYSFTVFLANSNNYEKVTCK